MSVMENEIWKDVVGYEGSYRVSNLGRVLSAKKNKILSPTRQKNGYIRIHLCKNGKAKLMLVHRLVAAAFLGKSDELVDHIDGSRDNNTLDNLRYLTQSQNIKLGWKKPRGVQTYISKKTGKCTHWVKICIFKSVIHIGTFDKKEDAYECYRKTHLEFFGYCPW